jgi:hypothetical protein
MTMKRSRCIPVVVLCGLIFLGVMVGPALVQAAPQPVAASFGLLMKPGWGPANSLNAGAVYVLRCAVRRGGAPRIGRIAGKMITATQVITTWGFVLGGSQPDASGYSLNPNCAAYMLPWDMATVTSGDYVPPR